jgi:acyl-CoA synthetase (NDP forming)/GNAT superfamily N-acetyltransferase
MSDPAADGGSDLTADGGSDLTADGGSDIVLSDGSTARLRPISPADADAIVALHSRFSERTRYLRYFSPYPRIPARDLRRFVEVDHRDREALVVGVGDRLIAVGRYDRLGPQAADAEVAFVVEDAHQGRGIGSVLLEHLADRARAVGISRFVAEVLPVNGAMLHVFAEGGYQVEREYADGVVHLTFPIAPTARSLSVQYSREQRSEAASIARLLAPRAVAVYGARADGTGIGSALLRHLRDGGFTGAVHVVHPDGLASLRAAAGPVDLAVVAVPAAAVPDVVADCAAAGVHGLVVVTAGFAEAGRAGALAQAQLVRTVHAYGGRLVGPNCLGIANTDPAVRLNATLSPRLPRPGRVGFFSQSAALGTALLAEADRRGLGLSSFVSAGNRADVSGNDLLQYWRADPGTDVVLLYLETFGNPHKFARIARELSRHKPVAAVAGLRRPPALDTVGAGPDERGVSALFAHSGVVRVDTVAELFDVGLLLAHQPLPAGHRLGVVTNAAALGALAAGAAPGWGLRLAAGHPRDVGPTAEPAVLAAAAAEAVADPAVDAVLVAYAPVLPEHWDSVAAVAEAVRVAVAGADRPVVAVHPAVEARAECSLPGAVPTYPAVEEAVRALGRAAGYAAWRREPAGEIPPLTLVDSPDLLTRYGIDVVPARQVDTVDDAAAVAEALGWPVALKVARSELRHRLDLGAVRLNLGGSAALRRAWDELTARFPHDGCLVQPMVDPGVACLIEVVEDPAFGPVVGFGLGGELGELLGDRAWRPVPLTDTDAASLVRAPRAAPLLTGYRGADPVDLDALADLVLRVSRLVDDHPELRRLELNPVLARPDGLSVLHATVHLGTATARPDTGPRRL